MPGDCHLQKKSKTEQGARIEKHTYIVPLGATVLRHVSKNKYNNGELERGLRMFGTAYHCEEECHKKLTGRSPSHLNQIIRVLL